MAKFETVTGGNIANTPLTPNKNAIMSPTEVAAFAPTEEQVAGEKTAAPELWEIVCEERWVDTRLGETISNKFHRVTRRMEVTGGALYSVATYALTYVRGVSNCSVTETMEFVPEKATKK